MKNETVVLVTAFLMILIMGTAEAVQTSFQLSEILVALAFSLVFTFAIGLEVVDKK